MLPLISPWSRAFVAGAVAAPSPLTRHTNFTQQIVQRYYADVKPDRDNPPRRLLGLNAPATLPQASVMPAAIPTPPLFLADEGAGAARSGSTPFAEGSTDEQENLLPVITSVPEVAAMTPTEAEEPPTATGVLLPDQAARSMPQLLSASTRPTEEVPDKQVTQPTPSPAQLSAARRETIRRSQANSPSVTATNAGGHHFPAQGIVAPKQADDVAREQPVAWNQVGNVSNIEPALPLDVASLPVTPPPVAVSGDSMVDEIERRIQRAAEERLNRGASALRPVADHQDESPATTEEPASPPTGGSIVEEIERRIQRSAEQRLQKSDTVATAPMNASNSRNLPSQAPLRRTRSSNIYSQVEEIKHLDPAAGYGTTRATPLEQNRWQTPTVENAPAVVDIAPVAQRTTTADLVVHRQVTAQETSVVNDEEAAARLGEAEDAASVQVQSLPAVPATLQDSPLVQPAAIDPTPALIPETPGVATQPPITDEVTSNRSAPTHWGKPGEPTSALHPQNQLAQGIVIPKAVLGDGAYESDGVETASLLRSEMSTADKSSTADNPVLPVIAQRHKADSTALSAATAVHRNDSVESNDNVEMRVPDEDQHPLVQEQALNQVQSAEQPALVQTAAVQLQRRRQPNEGATDSPGLRLDNERPPAESLPVSMPGALSAGQEEAASASGGGKKKQNAIANLQAAPVTNTRDKAADIEAKIQRLLTNRPLSPAQMLMSAPPTQTQVNRAMAVTQPTLPKVTAIATRPVEMNGAKAQKAAPDLDALARQVAPFVKRLLAIEREREP